jgi:hypothetical protein
MSLTTHDICQVSGVERSEQKPGMGNRRMPGIRLADQRTGACISEGNKQDQQKWYGSDQHQSRDYDKEACLSTGFFFWSMIV